MNKDVKEQKRTFLITRQKPCVFIHYKDSLVSIFSNVVTWKEELSIITKTLMR